MRNAFKLLGVLATVMVALCSSASAMCCGGGMGGGIGGGMSRGGGVNMVTTGGGGSRARTSEDKVTSKPDMPAAATVIVLNTKAWDNAYAQLNLTTEQQQKVDALLSDLKATAERLTKEQSDARAAYEKAVTQTVISETARKVMDAADAIKYFNPNTKFDLGIASILNSTQKDKYRELKMKS